MALEPIDIEVKRRLGNIGFTHAPFDDPDTDFYHASYIDPQNPRFVYDATIRHSVAAEKPFSYNVTRRQSGTYDDGSGDAGSSVDVTGNSEPVANLSTINQMVRRHNDLKEALGITSAPIRARASSDRRRLIMERADRSLRP